MDNRNKYRLNFPKINENIKRLALIDNHIIIGRSISRNLKLLPKI